MNLQELLAYLEERIDPEHVKKAEQLHIDAMDYRRVPWLPISIAYPTDPRVAPFSYSESIRDMEKMLYNELAAMEVNVLNAVELGDDYPLQIRANYGIGILCSLFGLPSVITMENMPWVSHLESLDELRAVVDHGMPALDAALGQKVRACCEYYRDKLSHYEKCAACIHITQPDLQGPFDVLHLMLGSNLFYALYDEPVLIHDALRLISETYIAYHNFITPYTTALLDGGRKCVVHRAVYGGTLVLKDDTATATLSEDMYAEFVAPYNAMVLRALCKTDDARMGSIHFCGARRKWHYPQMLAQPLNCLNFGNPELHDFEHDHTQLMDEKICVVGMGQEKGYELVKSYMNSGIRTGMTLLIRADSRAEAEDILRRHRSEETEVYL